MKRFKYVIFCSPYEHLHYVPLALDYFVFILEYSVGVSGQHLSQSQDQVCLG